MNRIKKLPIQSNMLSEAEEVVQKNIAFSLIDISPDNYRTHYSQQAILELATDLTLHGMISPVTVRPMPGDRYELVVGERRIRAARIAALEMIPAVIKDLTNEQAREIRLSENWQRENSHPMDEANCIAEMYREGKTIAQISERLSKSKTFIYSRQKLSALILPLQEIFFAEKLSLSEAMDLAGLAPTSQEEIFQRHCSNWQDENFSTRSFSYIIERYTYDLSEAPFDISDTTLISSVGACKTCPFNSATLNTLFPEMAKEAICSNKSCYHDKCLAQSKNQVLAVLEDFMPQAIVINGSLSDEHQIIFDSLEQTAGLPQHRYYDVTVFTSPTPPDKEDYSDQDIEDDNECFDQSGYDLALQEYNEDLIVFQQRIADPQTIKGIYVSYSEVTAVHFIPERRSKESGNTKVTSKEVQQAIKEGTHTPELLQAELSRLQTREQRAQEIDRDKVQLNLHGQLNQCTATLPLPNPGNVADLAAARLLVYQTLNYDARSQVNNLLLVDENLCRIKEPEQVYQKLAALSDSEYAMMIRLALLGKPESKMPANIHGIALYQMAVQAEVNVEQTEKDQAKIVKKRQKNLKVRIKDLQDRIKRMTPVTEQKEAA